MFDEYQPAPTPACGVCGELLNLCQGKDGPCLLLVWRQGERVPLVQRADEPMPRERLDELRLPSSFYFGCWCSNGHESSFVGRTVDGVWAETAPDSDFGLD